MLMAGPMGPPSRSAGETGIVVEKSRKNDELRLDGVRGAIRSVIRDAGHTPAVVTVHAEAHRARQQLEVAGRISLRKFRDEDAGFRADVATKRLAKSAVS